MAELFRPGHGLFADTSAGKDLIHLASLSDKKTVLEEYRLVGLLLAKSIYDAGWRRVRAHATGLGNHVVAVRRQLPAVRPTCTKPTFLSIPPPPCFNFSFVRSGVPKRVYDHAPLYAVAVQSYGGPASALPRLCDRLAAVLHLVGGVHACKLAPERRPRPSLLQGTPASPPGDGVPAGWRHHKPVPLRRGGSCLPCPPPDHASKPTVGQDEVVDEDGNSVGEVDLMPGGARVGVTDANKGQYLQLLAHYRLVGRFRKQAWERVFAVRGPELKVIADYWAFRRQRLCWLRGTGCRWEWFPCNETAPAKLF